MRVWNARYYRYIHFIELGKVPAWVVLLKHVIKIFSWVRGRLTSGCGTWILSWRYWSLSGVLNRSGYGLLDLVLEFHVVNLQNAEDVFNFAVVNLFFEFFFGTFNGKQACF